MNQQQQKASPGWCLLYFSCRLSAYGPYLMWLRSNISLLSSLQRPVPCLGVKAAQRLSSMIIFCGSRVGGFSWVVITWVFQPLCSWGWSGFKGFLAVIWVQDMIHKVQGKTKTLTLCSVIIMTSKIAESFWAGSLGKVHELNPHKAHPVWSAVGSVTK